MINDLLPYPEYKDAGVSWIEKIPKHWQVLPNRALFTEVIDRNHLNEQLLSVTIGKGIIKQSDLLANSSKKDSSNENKTNYKLVLPNDIAYNKMRAWQGAVGISKYRGIVSPAYIVVRLRSEQNPKYFHYLLRTPAFAKEAERWSYGITSDQWSLRAEDFKQIYCSLPPKKEQEIIINFIAHIERRINHLVRSKQRLIELLNEQKQAIIHKAVTRGLDSNVRLKPSGIDWLGDVPEHWETVSLKRACSMIRDGTHLPPPRVDKGIPLLSVRNIINGKFILREDDSHISEADYHALCRSFEIKRYDVLLAIVGGTIGKVAIVQEMPSFHIQRSLAVLRAKQTVLDYHFLAYFLQGPGFQRALWQTVAFSAQPGIYLGTINNFPIVLPPLDEQRLLVSTMDTAFKDVEFSIKSIYKEIELLREYRSRLISDVVTGKLDVRGVELPAMDETEELEDIDTGEEIEAEELIENEEVPDDE